MRRLTLAAVTAVALLLGVTIAPAHAIGSESWWRPKAGYATQWQWQLNGTAPRHISGVSIYGFDGFTATSSQVASLKAKGAKTICYMSAGAWEDWRPDANRFGSSVLGDDLDGWDGERWLDLRRISALKPLMAERAKVCDTKGFDAIEWDNVDGYTHRTGFPLTAKHQRDYNIMLAGLAHARGLAVALKNDVDQITTLEPYFDFAINEECFAYNECGVYRAFTSKGKLVLNVEYDSLSCTQAKSLNISSMSKRLSLNAWRQPCR